MKCSVQDCTGEYQETLIAQVFTRNGESVVIEDIPAKVCDVCGDTIVDWATVERLLQMLDLKQKPRKFFPVYSFERVTA
ncbi:MAG TPA: YgiT-type zinc finger protein [Anaerolineae bacterium]|nr:YgiT-type zinc finger protein [Anaerolineae bacterium]